MTDILGQEVVGDLIVDASEDVVQGVLGIDQALVMAGVGDYYKSKLNEQGTAFFDSQPRGTGN